MKYAFVVPARDKAPFVREAVRTALAQTFAPMDIVFSDQGSSDGTREIIAEEQARYGGRNRAYLLDCPEHGRTGNDGLNAHLNWLHGKLDCDFIIMGTADDRHHPERAARVIAAQRESDAAYVATAMNVIDASGAKRRTVSRLPQSGVVALDAVLADNVGAASTSAWLRAAFEAFGPLKTGSVQDIVVPVWASLRGPFHFIAEPLHDYRVTDANTGLEVRVSQSADEGEALGLRELMTFERMASCMAIADALTRTEPSDAGAPNAVTLARAANALNAQIVEQSLCWAAYRSGLIERGLRPLEY